MNRNNQCIVALCLLLTIQIPAIAFMPDDTVAGTAKLNAGQSYRTVDLYYFPDSVAVLKLLRPDASEVDAKEFTDARDAAKSARTAARKAELELQQADGEMLDASKRLAEARVEQSRAEQTVKAAADDVRALQAQDDRLAATDANLDKRIQSINAELGMNPPEPRKSKLMDQKADLEGRREQIKMQREGILRQKGDAETRKSDAEKAAAGAQGGADSAQARVSTARTKYDEMRKALGTKQVAAAIAVAEQWDAQVAQDKSFRKFRATASSSTSGKTPIERLDIHTVSPSVLLLIGSPDDIEEAVRLIDQLDRPTSQARATLWTLQVNGQGGRAGLKTLEKITTGIEEEFGLTRNQIGVSIALLQECIQEEAWKQELDQKNRDVKPEPIYAFFHTTVRELTAKDKLQKVMEELGRKERLHPLSVSTLGEALIVLMLADDTPRNNVLTQFITRAPARLAGLEIEAGKRRGQSVNEPGILKHYQELIQFRQLFTLLGFDARKQYGIQPSVSQRTALQLELIRSMEQVVPVERFLWFSKKIDEAKANLVMAEKELIAIRDAVAKEADPTAKRQRNLDVEVAMGERSGRMDWLKKLRLAMVGLPPPYSSLGVGAGTVQGQQLTDAMRNRTLRDSLPGQASADQVVKRLMEAVEDDFNNQFILPRLRKIRELASADGVELGIVQRTSVLATNRMPARVDPKASIEFNFPEPDNLLRQAMGLAKIVSQAQTDAATGGLASGLGKGGGGKFGGTLDKLASEPSEEIPQIYKVESGAQFELVPIQLPDGQSMAFDLNYTLSNLVREPENTKGRRIGKIERHSISTRVQDSSFELRELSRFETQTKLQQPVRRAGGIPLLKEIPIIRDIPIIGYFVRTKGRAAGLQESLIFVHTVTYPTMRDLLALVR